MPPGRHTSHTITLTAAQRTTLERLVRARTIQACLMMRARIILLLAQGETIATICRRVGLGRRHVYKWIARWEQDGLAGLYEQPRRRPHQQQPTAIS